MKPPLISPEHAEKLLDEVIYECLIELVDLDPQAQ